MPTLEDLPLTRTQVLVVGAGPTGLTAGLVLARRGVAALVVDHRNGPARQSRALLVQARTMEIHDQLGLARQVLVHARPATRLQIHPQISPQINPDPHLQGLNVAGAQGGQTPYPGLHVLEQSYHEQLLSDALTAAGRSVRWQHRLLDLRPSADAPGVTALVEGPDGLVRVQARWCVGADGADSSVRRQLNLPFEGATDEAVFHVADLHGVTGVTGVTDGSLTLCLGRSTFGVLIPLGPGGRVRLITLAGADNGESIDQQAALAAAAADLGLTWNTIEWFSEYRVHHRVARHFRQGEVFLAGDAAHVHSPLGGQGMNTGVQDAHHLAHLLADVSRQYRSPAALERYERERRPVAVRLVRGADRALGVLARRGHATAWLRRGAGHLLTGTAARALTGSAGTVLAGLIGQYRIRYHFVSAGMPVPAWADDPTVGVRLPPTAQNLPHLRSLSWQMHTYGMHAARPHVPGWIEGPHPFEAHELLRRDRLYLVRPDGFVAASLPAPGGVADEQALRSAMSTHHLNTTT